MSEGPLCAIVCEASPRTQRAIAASMERHGIRLALVAPSITTVLRETSILLPDVVVVDVALAGVDGVGVIRRMLDASPGCTVVLLAPFDTLREAAIAAGAHHFVLHDDLEELETCLERLARGRRAPQRPQSVSVPGDFTGTDAPGPAPSVSTKAPER